MNLRFFFCIAPAVIASMAAADIPELNMPIVQTKFTADPAPMLHNDTIFLYTSHDESDAEGFKMYDWLLYTTTDMVNWQDRGAVASLDCFKWYDGKTEHGLSKLLNATANTTCTARYTGMESGYLQPTRLTGHSPIR